VQEICGPRDYESLKKYKSPLT